ncbi:hypothetical protein Bbelb_305670 [Branchiostoma belcheri]|nr:hypothetical protein Bbelb_305670 [Branchiostoma belcheri]
MTEDQPSDAGSCIQPYAVAYLEDDEPVCRPTDTDATSSVRGYVSKHQQDFQRACLTAETGDAFRIQQHVAERHQDDEHTCLPTDVDDIFSVQPSATEDDKPVCRPAENNDTFCIQPHTAKLQQDDKPACSLTYDDDHIHIQPYAVQYQDDDEESAFDQKVTNHYDIQPYAVGYREDDDSCNNQPTRSGDLAEPTTDIIYTPSPAACCSSEMITTTGLFKSVSTETEPTLKSTPKHGESRSGSVHMENTTFSVHGTRPGESMSTYGLVVSSNNEIFVAVVTKHIQIYSMNGVHLRFFSTVVPDEYEPLLPTDVTIDGEGHLWVAGSGHIMVANNDNDRVDMFTYRGKFVRTVVNIPNPWGIALGPEGQLVVANTKDNTVTIFPRRLAFP